MNPRDCPVCMDLARRLIAARLDNDQSAISDVRVLQRRHFDEVRRGDPSELAC